MRKRWIALIVVGAVLVAALATAYLWGRSLFQMPTAQKVDSVIGEIGGERVLGVFSHPDDEQTVNGLFWRAHDQDDAYTAMVTITPGEAGTQVPVVARQEDLGVVRTAEALKNSFHLGVDEHGVWDHPDGGVPEADEAELVDRLAATITRIEPDVIVGFWPASGATGHADHMETGHITELAIAKVAQESADRGTSYAGPDQLVYTISPTKALEMFGGETGAFVADNQPDPHYAMPAEVGLKKDGWEIHASQEDYLQASYGLPGWLVYALWDQEF
ncbi:PIG-L deacetylase family protein [Demequina sediminicola]|uniref:PIG-L deacetylase family protein n=1 Tax=Demequina sediminicola TaxID=1095026 RepID=UPI000783927B|nr:PIG-L family deacetylase [Demequina sediminicola]